MPATRPPLRGRHKPRVRPTLATAKAAAAATGAARERDPQAPSGRGEPAAHDGKAARSRRGEQPATKRRPDAHAPAPRDAAAGHPPAKAGRGEAAKLASADRGAARKSAPPRREATRERFFVSCPRGLEAELDKELRELGASELEPASGGISLRAEMEIGWKINLWSRLAIRVLLRVAEGRYKQEEDLYQAALAVDWPAWFDVERTLAVTTVGKNSPLKSLNFVSLRVKDAVCDRFRQVMDARPSVDTRKPDVPLTLFLSSDRYNLYIDLSGEPLNRRGYRVQASAAPLNENLAAGMLKLSGWTPDMPLYDPMMGGGTLLLEAAMIALDIAPGLNRRFAFEHLRNFDRIAWTRLRKDAEAAARERRPLPIFGSDINPAMVRAAGLNLRAAGLFDCVRLMAADFLNVDPPAPSGLIVSNPPYGVRMGAGRPGDEADAEEATTDQDAAALAVFYKALGDNLKQHFPGWTACLLSADPELPKKIGLRATRRITLFNGPLECRLLEYRMVAGSLPE